MACPPPARRACARRTSSVNCDRRDDRVHAPARFARAVRSNWAIVRGETRQSARACGTRASLARGFASSPPVSASKSFSPSALLPPRVAAHDRTRRGSRRRAWRVAPRPSSIWRNPSAPTSKVGTRTQCLPVADVLEGEARLPSGRAPNAAHQCSRARQRSIVCRSKREQSGACRRLASPPCSARACADPVSRPSSTVR